jgi:hypothetical protein
VTGTHADENPIATKFYELLYELREKHVYILGTLGASLISAATFLPYYPLVVDAQAQPHTWIIVCRVVCLVLIPVFAAADKVADWHAKKTAEKKTEEDARKAQENYHKSISSLLSLAHRGADMALETPGQRKPLLQNLSTVLVTATVGLSSAPDSRATYYTLSFTGKGRVLSDPVSEGRVEQAVTIWEESKNREHPVWGIMDGADVNAPIVRSSDPDKSGWVDWDKKKYKSFISVPVKAHGVQFGMLSLNAPKSEDITETDRMAVLVAARIMAATLSLAMETRVLKEFEVNLLNLKRDQEDSVEVAATSDSEDKDSMDASVVQQ